MKSLEREMASLLDEYLQEQRVVLRLASSVDPERLDDDRQELEVLVRDRYPGLAPELAEAVVRLFAELTEVRRHEGADLDRVLPAMSRFIDVAQELSVEPQMLGQVISDWTERQRFSPPSPVFYKSLLASLTAGFVTFAGELAKVIYQHRPHLLKPDKQSLTWGEIAGASSIDELRNRTIDLHVEAMVRGPARDLVSSFTTSLGVKLPVDVPTPSTLEIFLRRNVCVHNRGRASEQYLRELPNELTKPDLGCLLNVDLTYLAEAADRLMVLAFILVWSSALQLGKLDEERRAAFERWMVNLPYRLLQDRRYLAVERMTRPHFAEAVHDSLSKEILRVNHWLAFKRRGKLEQCRPEIEAWQTHALSKQFQLAKLALLDNMEEGLRLVEEIRGTDDLPLTHWQTWPLLEELRRYEQAKIVDGAPEPDVGS